MNMQLHVLHVVFMHYHTIHSLVPGLQEKRPRQFKLYMAVTSQQLQ